MSWLVHRDEMTVEQLRAIEISPEEHRVIFGAPGSGKTQILLHRAKYIADMWNVPAKKYHIFVFTNVLKLYIQSALNLLDLDSDSISTFDSWCMNYYRNNVNKYTPWNKEEKCTDFSLIRAGVLNYIKKNDISPFYDFIMVDEGQDLTVDAFEILKSISKHITVCMDHKQKIYQGGADELSILSKLGLRKRNMSLLEAFRCCPYLVYLAAQFIDNPEERSMFIGQARTAQTERETPILYYAKDFEDERKKLIDIVKIRINKGERVAILLPQKRQVYGFTQTLKEAGLEVENQIDSQKNDKQVFSLDFNSLRPKVLTFHSAKGLTVDTVMMPRLVTTSFHKGDPSSINRLLFIGISRATKWVFMSTNEKGALSAFDNLISLANEKFLTIQKNTTDENLVPEVAKNDFEDEDDLTDLL